MNPRLFRTPDEHFDNLPDWPFQPRYTTIETTIGPLRIAAIDEGPRDAAPILLLHGEPTWGYLYRHMIPTLVAAGLRVIAPDLPGLGRSDKPIDPDDVTYSNLVDWMTDWLTANQLDGITMFCQDWGGLIGLRVLARHPELFARLVVSNTLLPTGEQPLTDAFTNWLEFSQTAPDLPIGTIVQFGTVRELAAAEVAAYDTPFPTEASKTTARRLPALVPTDPASPDALANRAAWDALAAWTKPTLSLFSDSDPITSGGDRRFIDTIPGASGQPHQVLAGGGHFVQEDNPNELCHELLAFIERTSCQ